MWLVRGYFTVAATLVLAYGVSKLPTGGWGLFVSRKITYFAISTAAAFVVLVVFFAAASLAGDVAGRWAPAVRVALFSIGLLAMVVFATSDSVRAQVAVMLKKHLMEPKFDYREEWLRLIETMTDESLDLSLDKRAIKSLAQIVPAESGQLWFRDAETNQFTAIAAWDEPLDERTTSATNPFVEFLAEKGWVIDLRDIHRNPEDYVGVDAETIKATLPGVDLLIPLLHENKLIGYAALRRLESKFALNYEDHDLLKTAGKQVASFLVQARASEKLAEARQFEAYNRFTAFVMHDLKNAIAQQSLVVDNAEKHKRNPEFIDDAIETIKAGVRRLRRVLRYLQQRPLGEPWQRVELSKLLYTVASECSDREPSPRVRCPESPVFIRADRERLEMALGHAVRNAQDATDRDGEIFLEGLVADSTVNIIVRDSGRGMDLDFIRNRLFRPFDSTKGADGMGIGAYQLRETVRSIGGDLSVASQPGEGTAITITLPCVA
jgi:putative PEP-CTERM system histidine kinase